MELSGHTALVTGAAGGIGACLTRLLARKGCHLALADVNSGGLADLATQLSGTGVNISTHVADMSDPSTPDALLAEVMGEHWQLSLLFNNAGIALGGTFEQVEKEDFDRLLQINLLGPIQLVRAALPVLRQAPEAAIVNTSSLFGLIAPPGQTAYCASKFGLRGFTESLRHELQDSTITVLPVHPGGIATNIARDAKFADEMSRSEHEEDLARMDKLLKMQPEKAAEIILTALERRQRRVLVGSDAKMAELIQRVLPGAYWAAVSRFF